MKYGDNWSMGRIPEELEGYFANRIKGYYKWKLKIGEVGYAHVFFCEFDGQKALKENWENIVDSIAAYIQSDVPDMLEKSNFYVCFFVTGTVEKDIIKRIEDDTYSSQKFVVLVDQAISMEEKLEWAKKRLFTFDLMVSESDHPMITGVEFFNFRIFKGKRIFDFRRKGEPARLVVLFAPNGMGKTSFFDGIEWGLSGEVSRFAEIADKNVSKRPVLKNTEAGEESAYVKISQQGDGWIKRTVPKLNNRTKKDYGNGRIGNSKNNPLKEYMSEEKANVWGNLVLPHHKIDGFIAGMKPTVLYKEWGSLWDAGGEKRRLFKEAYDRKRDESKRYEDVKGKYEKLQQRYKKLDGDRNFVKKLEQDVERFHKISENTVIVKLEFSTIDRSGYLQWSNLVDKQYDLYEKMAEAIERKCSYLEHEIGHDIETYCVLSAKKQEDAVEYRKVRDYLVRCHEKNLLLVQKKDLEEKLEGLGNEIKAVQFIYDKGEEWYRDAVQYFETDARMEELKRKMEDIEKRISSMQDEDSRLMIELDKKERTYKEEEEYRRVCEHARELAKCKEEQEKLLVQKESCRNKILDKQKTILEIERKLGVYEEKRIGDFENAKERHKKNIASLEENAVLQRIQTALFELLKEYQGLEKHMSFVVQQILAEEQAEERIKNILEDIRKIIEEQKLSDCPVCNTSFICSQELLQHTYKVVSKEGTERKREKCSLEAKASSLRRQIEDTISEFNMRLDMLTGALREEREHLERGLLEEKKEEEGIEKSIDILRERIEKIQRQDQEEGIFVIYQEEGIQNWRNMWNARLEKEIADVKTVIQKNAEQKTAYQIQLANCQKKLDAVKSLIFRVEAQSPESYAMMMDLEMFMKQHIYSVIHEWIGKQEIEQEGLKMRAIECGERLDRLQDIFVSLEAEYEKRDAQMQLQMETVMKDLSTIRKRMEEALAAEISGEAEDMEGYFNAMAMERKQVFQKEREHIARCIEALGKLKYNREVENYFQQWEETSKHFKKAEEEEAAGKRKLEEAEKNYQRQKEIVEQEMEEFLRKYRVGEIYEKLEPHETLKRLGAKFSFDEKGQPELSFCVIGEEGETYPPAWFLSTAQLNVVAFSVFLGRALQTEDAPLKTIFIDDPIGHFDEMNIVGFVDLLRIILENTDRQLIISTHEERVFRLINRKMPKENYPVCYIDFRERRM